MNKEITIEKRKETLSKGLNIPLNEIKTISKGESFSFKFKEDIYIVCTEQEAKNIIFNRFAIPDVDTLKETLGDIYTSEVIYYLEKCILDQEKNPCYNEPIEDLDMYNKPIKCEQGLYIFRSEI